jgi:hypothetical protein
MRIAFVEPHKCFSPVSIETMEAGGARVEHPLSFDAPASAALASVL